MNIYEEALDEALGKGVDNGTAHKETVTAAARTQVGEIVAADDG